MKYLSKYLKDISRTLFRDRCTPLSHYVYPFEMSIATVFIDLVSIYIDLVSERANLIFAPEKARGYSAFSLTK